VGDAIGSVRAVGRAIVSPALWFGLLRQLLSWEGLFVAVLLVLVLPVAMLVSLVFPPWGGWMPPVYLMYWAVPAISRLVAPVVAHHVIAPQLPADLHEEAPPEARVYRHWWFPATAVSLPAFLAWRFMGQVGPAWAMALTVLLSLIATGFLVRSTLCTCFPSGMIERSLKQRRWGWPAAAR